MMRWIGRLDSIQPARADGAAERARGWSACSSVDKARRGLPSSVPYSRDARSVSLEREVVSMSSLHHD